MPHDWEFVEREIMIFLWKQFSNKRSTMHFFKGDLIKKVHFFRLRPSMHALYTMFACQVGRCDMRGPNNRISNHQVYWNPSLGDTISARCWGLVRVCTLLGSYLPAVSTKSESWFQQSLRNQNHSFSNLYEIRITVSVFL